MTMDSPGELPAPPGLASETWESASKSRSASALIALVLCLSLTVSALLAAAFSVHWPLVGDASLIHYIAFLIERGWSPYRQLGDMNMPGSFLVELAAMHIFGPGALAWRLFDFTLALAASAAYFAILRPANLPRGASRIFSWLAPIFASTLFFLIHTRDGLAQGGQRDLTMAVALVSATAFLIRSIRRDSRTAAAAFGLLSGLAVTIKPTAILLTGLQIVLAIRATRSSARPTRRLPLAPAALGWTVAPALSLGFLLREHALHAFLQGFHGIVPYYSSLGHRPLAYILQHSLSPVLPLVLLWLACLLLHRRTYPSADTILVRYILLSGVLFGVLNCILQQRALPYYRYSLLAFLLPLIALDIVEVSAPGRTQPISSAQPPKSPRQQTAQILAVAALAFGSLFLAPQSAILIHRFRWQQTDMLDSLQHTLESLGGPALSGHIQCIDSVSGCNTVLYRMRLEPATGVLSDFLLFGNTTDREPPEAIPVLRDTRIQFAAALTTHPPDVIVVTSHLHITGPDDFGKLSRWPWLSSWLDTHYTLATEWHPTRPERWWSREELPASYRIYTLRQTP